MMQSRAWTAEEDAIVRNGWRTKARADLFVRLPGRTPNAIRIRASILGVTEGAKPFTFGDLVAPPVSADRLALLALIETCDDLIAQLEPLPKTQALVAGKLGQSLKAARRVLEKP